jgi:hypothetical protein
VELKPKQLQPSPQKMEHWMIESALTTAIGLTVDILLSSFESSLNSSEIMKALDKAIV